MTPHERRDKETKDFFPFYARDFLSSPDVHQLSDAAGWAYMKLLCHQWVNRGLPTDRRRLARLVGKSPAAWARIWDELEHLFEVREERLFNPKLERIRSDVEAQHERHSAPARLRWAISQGRLPAGSTLEDLRQLEAGEERRRLMRKIE